MARIYPRSSLCLKFPLIGGGVVDSNYKGNFCVIITNLLDRTGEFEKEDRIAQVLFVKKEDIEFEEVFNFEDFRTDTGSKSFGSSGKKIWKIVIK